MKPVRIAVVGVGRFGQLHALTLAHLAEAELVGVIDPNKAALEAIGNELSSVRRWSCLETAMKECDAEGWIVASSTASHIPVARALLAAGHKVLVEKPLGEDISCAESLAPLVVPGSSNLMLGHVLLFSSEFRQLQQEARRRSPINYIDGVRHRPVETIRHYPCESPLRLTMVHDLYCVLALMDRKEPSRFNAQLRRTETGTTDLVLAQLQWDDSVVASLTASFLTPEGMPGDGFDRLEVFGRGWACRIDANPRPLQLWDERARWPMGLEIQIDSMGTNGMLANELRCFCYVIRGERRIPLGATYADALQIEHWLKRLEAVTKHTVGAQESY